ncbi:MAG: hypothetical protein PUA96_01985 [Bacteroidales bacterium]|nr:hypothetical protein [Bacteroidales bacterium]
MDIDLLSKMVKVIILDKDEVTLPGVGTFVAELVPSTFSDKGYTINPPYKKLSFRQIKNENDKSIAELYASGNNIDVETAERIVNDFLAELKDILTTRKSIVFPGLGKLRATKENYFFFIADEDLDIYPDGFGLEPVSLKSHEESISEVSETMASLRSILEPEEAETPEEEASLPEDLKVTAGYTPEKDTSVTDSSENVATETTEEKTTEESEGQDGECGELTGDAAGIDDESVQREEAPGEEEPITVTEIRETPEEEASLPNAPETSAEDTPEDNNSVTDCSEPAAAGTVAKGTAEESGEQDREDIAARETADESAVKDEASKATEDAQSQDEAKIGKGGPSASSIMKWTLIILIILAAAALALFLILAHTAPDFIDSILYTPEELEILRH